MGWRETCAVDERMRFVMAAEKREEPFAAICRQFGVSRKAGYKWLARYREAGVEGLLDRSRAPLNRRQAIGEEVAERCLAVRRAHPTWGPLKARAFLERRAPSIDWPAPSTIGLLFDREGLTVKRKLRRRSPPSSAPFADCGAANDVWCIDFKGWFLTGDGARCEPLTLTDAMSRYLLRCQALARTDGEHVWAVLDAAFREFGLPLRLRSDNGSPFASIGVGGLSRLSVLVIKAGVKPERIAPGKPQQNGRHERMHLTLLKDAATPPAMSLREQLDRFRAFQRVYNEERPHQGLGNATPPPSAIAPRPAAGTACCASPTIRSTMRSGGCAPTARSNGGASSSTSIARSPASRSASPRTPTAGRSASARSFSARSPMAAIACASPNPPAVDLWTTLRVAHRVHSLSSSNIRPERNRNCVTHVIGQICYLCFRLLNIPGGFDILDSAGAITAKLNKLKDSHIDAVAISDNGNVGASVEQLTTDKTAIVKLQNANLSRVLLAINDTTADIEAGLSTLVQEAGEIASITASDDPIDFSAATFLADRAALDKLVGGFDVSDTAATVMADLEHLDDPNISTITISDSGQITASVAQLTADASAIGKLKNANGSPVVLAIHDMAGDVQCGLSTLVQDTGEIGSITTSNGRIVISAATFLADQSTLDKIAEGFDVSVAAANLVAALSTLNADFACGRHHGRHRRGDADGRRRRESAELLGNGLGDEPDRQRGPRLCWGLQSGFGLDDRHNARGYAFADGDSEPERDDERGREACLGRRERDHRQQRDNIRLQLVDLRRRHGRDARQEPHLRGVIQRGRRRHVRPVGRRSRFEQRGDLHGGTVDGSNFLYTEGTTTVSGLTIGGTVEWENTAGVTQSDGTVTIGGSSGDEAILFNT